MRILIFSTRFLPLTGGVQTYVALLAEGLVREGQHTTVVTSTAPNGFNDREASYPVVRQPSLLQLWHMVGETDVIQLAGPSFIPLLFALLRRKPVVIEHHNYQAICPNGLLLYQPNQSACPGHFMPGRHWKCWRCVATTKGWAASIWQWGLTFPRRWMCKHATVNAPITQHVLNRLQLPRSRVIYYGIPDAAPERESLVSIANAPLCFAYVGRLVAEKGLPLLVEAARRLRERNCDFRLKFIGDGPERLRLEHIVADKGLSRNVTFTGFLRARVLREATEDVAAVVMPSIWEETAGLAAIEQMMRGRLVIAADIGGLGEVVNGAGLKFAVGDVNQLAECMQKVIENPDLIAELGREARSRSGELFREDQMIRNHLLTYREVLEVTHHES